MVQKYKNYFKKDILTPSFNIFGMAYFVMHAIFRNFGFAELTWHSEIKKEKITFFFVFLPLFRNFASEER